MDDSGNRIDYRRLVPDPATIRTVFAAFPQGIAAIAAEVDGTREVLLASTFTVGISLEPPLALFAVQQRSGTWPRLREATTLGVSMLSAHQDGFARQLAARDPAARFAGLDTHVGTSGAVFLREATVWLECGIEREVEAGDHTVVIVEVAGLYSVPSPDPLVFHGSQFRRLESDSVD